MKMYPAAVLLLLLTGCNDSDNSSENTSSTDDTIDTIDTTSPINVTEKDTDSSVFISDLDVGLDINSLSSVSFTIQPMPGTFSKPIKATFTPDALTTTESGFLLPVFGLYSGYDNQVTVDITLTDGATRSVSTQITTSEYIDPNGNYDNLQINKKLDTNNIAFSYLHLENNTDQGPIIVDVDGNLRWTANTPTGDYRFALFENGRFVIQDNDELVYLSLTGDEERFKITSSQLTQIRPHHETSKGKTGYFLNVDTTKNGNNLVESVLLEVDQNGNEIDHWDFGEIISTHLTENSEDPSDFIRNGIDWFHMNSAIYSPDDDSIIVSSRENFVVKIDYASKKMKWLLGDETKHWFVNHPSLQPLSLTSSDTKPIGQHALSIVNGELMLFNNGQLSFNQPAGAPTGIALASSLAMSFAIDESSMTADATWIYDAGIFSDICSSVYKSGDNYLITYSAVDRTNDNPNRVVIRAIDSSELILFEIELDGICQPWNTNYVELSNLTYQ